MDPWLIQASAHQEEGRKAWRGSKGRAQMRHGLSWLSGFPVPASVGLTKTIPRSPDTHMPFRLLPPVSRGMAELSIPTIPSGMQELSFYYNYFPTKYTHSPKRMLLRLFFPCILYTICSSRCRAWVPSPHALYFSPATGPERSPSLFGDTCQMGATKTGGWTSSSSPTELESSSPRASSPTSHILSTCK